MSDVNVDGRPDLVITRELPPPACSLQNPDSLEVWLNLPSGWLAAWSEATPWMTYDITMGDYNGDGYPDIAWGGVPPYGCLLTPSDCELKVKLGTGTGTFGATSTLLPSLVPGGCIGKLASQDMDSDGYDDVVMLMGGWPATYVQLLYGHPTQNLAVGAAVAVLSYSPIGWFVGDVDGDGVKDILVVHVYGGFQSYIGPSTWQMDYFTVRGTGARTFSPAIYEAGPNPTPLIFPVPLAADFDSDGDLDVAIYSGSTTQFSYVQNRAVYGSGAPGQLGVPGFPVGQAVVGNAGFFCGLSNGAPWSVAGLAVSAAEAWPGLGPVGIDPAHLVPLPVAASGVAIVGTDSLGNASVAIPVPASGALRGLLLFAQWAVADPLGSYQTGAGSFALTRSRRIFIP